MLLEPAKNETGGVFCQKGVPKKFANNSAGIPLLYHRGMMHLKSFCAVVDTENTAAFALYWYFCALAVLGGTPWLLSRSRTSPKAKAWDKRGKMVPPPHNLLCHDQMPTESLVNPGGHGKSCMWYARGGGGYGTRIVCKVHWLFLRPLQNVTSKLSRTSKYTLYVITYVSYIILLCSIKITTFRRTDMSG